MKTQANFLIKHYEYFNENGNVSHEYYYIQEWKKSLWWSYWKDIKHTESGNGSKTRTTFKTLEEAKDFVRNVLCPELPRETRRETTVDEMVCINGESKW
jgi:hypothetical protein